MTTSRIGFPSAWSKLCQRERGRKRTSGDKGSRDLNRAAARYRLASLFNGIDVKPPGSKQLAAGYAAGIRLLLAYSAYEAVLRAAGKPKNTRPPLPGSKLHASAKHALRECLRAEPKVGKLLQSDAKHELPRKVQQFINGEDKQFFDAVSVLRHLIAHGNWSAWGGGAETALGRKALKLVAEYLLEETDLLFDEVLARFQA